jgi:prephenate dehydratase
LSYESHDTADSARDILEHRREGVAAIAGPLAADLYGLEILAKSIENIHQNYTRFLVASAEPEQDRASVANKASLCFHTIHKVGALAQAMNVFRDNGLNLGLIQSVPIPGQPDEYAFHVDVEWLERVDYDEALDDLKKLTRDLKVLGEYQSGIKPYEKSGTGQPREVTGD